MSCGFQNRFIRRWLSLWLVLCWAQAGWAYGFDQPYEWPVRLELYMIGAVMILVVAFAGVVLFVRSPGRMSSTSRLNMLWSPLGRVVAHPAVRSGMKLMSVGLFIAFLIMGLVGKQSLERNLTLILVWVNCWVGVACVSAFVGNIWALMNPWKTLFEWVERLYCRLSGENALARHLPYPKGLGVWPGLLLYLVFAWAGLVFDTARPSNITGWILVYSGVTWAGMFCFGQHVWLRYGEAFTILFSLLARFSPTEVRVSDVAVCQACPLDCQGPDGLCVDCYTCFAAAEPGRREWNVRPFAAGLLLRQRVLVSEMVFILVVLATMIFDILMETSWWAEIAIFLQNLLLIVGPARIMVVQTFGLLVIMLLCLEVYLLISTLMALGGGWRAPITTMAHAFVVSLVPIVIAYHLVHHLEFLLMLGQDLLPLLSDPFGWGWNLFGTASYQLRITVVGSELSWYLFVITIVVGHVIAVYLAYVIALRMFQHPPLALNSQYPMLGLCVGLTVFSLWILAPPIVTEEVTDRPTYHLPQHNVTLEPGPELFMSIHPLPLGRDYRPEWRVKSPVLCFCLDKASATIRILRQAATEQFELGLVALQQHSYVDAIGAFNRTIQLEPRNARAHVNRGLAHVRMQAYENAYRDFARALQLEPRLAEARAAHEIVSKLLGMSY